MERRQARLRAVSCKEHGERGGEDTRYGWEGSGRATTGPRLPAKLGGSAKMDRSKGMCPHSEDDFIEIFGPLAKRVPQASHCRLPILSSCPYLFPPA